MVGDHEMSSDRMEVQPMDTQRRRRDKEDEDEKEEGKEERIQTPRHVKSIKDQDKVRTVRPGQCGRRGVTSMPLLYANVYGVEGV